MHNLAGSTPTSSSEGHVSCFLVRAHISEHIQNMPTMANSANLIASINAQIQHRTASPEQHCRHSMSHKCQVWTPGMDNKH